MSHATQRFMIALCCAPLALPVAAVAAFLVNAHFDARAGEAFDRIRMGTPESDVVALLGRPDVERPCGRDLWWGGDYDYRGRNDGRCVTEVRYEYFLSAWAVGYSTDGHVVSKYHYFSE
jgi:hypothetical protein